MRGRVPKLHDYWGERKTAAELAEIAGVSIYTMRKRLHPGHMSAEEAVAYRRGEPVRRGPIPKTYEFRGEQKTAKEIAAITGFNSSWAYHRDARKGTKAKRAVRRIVAVFRAFTPDTKITFDGTTQPISEHALDYGLTPTVIIERLGRGMSVEEAITTPMAVTRGQKLPSMECRP